jgi:magnesium transporter
MDKIIFNGITWINIENVSKADTEYLRQEFEFHPLDLKDCLGASQRPKIDIYDNYFFLVLHFPFLDKEQNVLRTSDLNVFLTKTHLITVQKKPIKHLNQLFGEIKDNRAGKAKMFQKSTGLMLYYILNKLYHFSLSIIDDLSTDLSEIEESIYAHKAKVAVRELAVARRNNLNMRGTLNPQRLVVNTLAHIQKDWFNKDGQLTLYFDDILDYLEKNWILLENQKEWIDGLRETNESLISYKTNAIITVLTVFSVAIMPLTLLTGFYGMNVKLPLAHNPMAIWAIFAVVSFFTVMMIYYLVTRREWI